MAVSVLPVSALSFGLLAATFYAMNSFLEGYSTNSPLYLCLVFVLTGCLGCVAFISTVFTLRITDRLLSDTHTTFTALAQFLFTQVLAVVGRFWTMKSLEEDTRKASQAQEKFLAELLSENAKTEYGIRYDFAEVKNKVDYVAQVPLSTYKNYKDYVKKITKGEQRILTEDTVTYLSMTAGTTGAPTVIPTTYTSLGTYIKEFSVPTNYVVSRDFPSTKKLQKSLMMTFPNVVSVTEGGLPIGPLSGTSSDDSQLMWLMQTTPKAVLGIREESKIIYIHILFALLDKNMCKIVSNFTSTVYTMFVALETNWEQLVDDIERGSLEAKSDISLDVRQELNTQLSPRPGRAAELRKEFEKGFDDIARRIWPSLVVIVAGDSGTVGHYGDLIRKKYVRDVPIYSSIYSATECGLGVNLWPLKERSNFVLRTRANFYEFIPIEETVNPDPKTLFLDEVEVDEEYEVVVTTVGGLYRYRLGDVIKVTGFYNNCPVVEYRYKRSQSLSVVGENITEDVLYMAVRETVDMWDSMELIDFSSTESVLLDDKDTDQGKAPHYVLFLELESKNQINDIEVTDDKKEMFDQVLRKHAPAYESRRREGNISSPRVCVLKEGAFAALVQHQLKNNPTSYNQVKIPRVLTCAEHIDLLLEQEM
ncbi:GH3 domain-containing protein-like [Ptychodera flava]|uniref:GH3 domain-containing protein-like n=1 Tax=Ptychodera flava TaxID=63121 RepID=UPI00396A7F22